jgi:hypothetical protein
MTQALYAHMNNKTVKKKKEKKKTSSLCSSTILAQISVTVI